VSSIGVPGKYTVLDWQNQIILSVTVSDELSIVNQESRALPLPKITGCEITSISLVVVKEKRKMMDIYRQVVDPLKQNISSEKGFFHTQLPLSRQQKFRYSTDIRSSLPLAPNPSTWF
jgi:hypothetical protein